MRNILSRHKVFFFIVILLLAGGGYYGYTKFRKGGNETRYVLGTVERGVITVAVSGSGQVSTTNQIDIKPRASGDVVFVGAVNSQEVRAGTLLVQLDSRDAQKAVRDAETNLAGTKLSLAKLEKPADALSILQAENALANTKETKQKSEDNLVKAYEDGFTTVANAFLDLPTIIAGLKDILFGMTLSATQENINYYTNAIEAYASKVSQYKSDASRTYQIARTAYDTTFDHYKSATRFSDVAVTSSLISETYETTKSMAEAVKSANNLIQFYKDKIIEQGLKTNALADTHLGTLTTYTGKTNTHLLNLSSVRTTIQTNKETIVSADRSIAEKTASLADLKAGADPLDIQSQELAVQQRSNALLDAREKLADYFVRAPFDGVVANMHVKKGDAVSASTTVATFITKKQIAEISLNEVDVAKVKAGQRATLTFDAIPDLSITGVVAKIDTIGTVSQGVVSYIVEITFDTQDERVKPGMSVTASIVTDVKTNVLFVSNAAIKSQGALSLVQVVPAAEAPRDGSARGVTLPEAPVQQTVKIGIANDDVTEILSGLSEGDWVVTGTINTQTANTQNQTPAFRIPGLPGGGGGGGGGNRMIGR